MLSTVVFERKNEDIAAQVAKNLVRMKWRCDGGLIIAPRFGKKHAPALVVVSPKTAQEISVPHRAVCGTLLIPGNCIPPPIRANNIYTYGMSSDDFITLSSLSSAGYVLSVQREISPLTGGIIDAQDIPVKRKPSMSADGILALSSTLLLLGVPPDMLQ